MNVWLRRTLIAATLLMALNPPALAAADGDPASDVLLAADVFYPYSPPVAVALQHRLNAETAAAKRAGFPIKVALIHSPVDLGAIPELFGKPQPYAKFLDQEISLTGTKQLLLVVMPSGFGVGGLSPRATAAAATLTKPAGSSANALAQAAIAAVLKLAAADGHPIAGTGNASTAGSGGSATLPILIAVIVVAVAASAGVIVYRRRAARGR